MTSVEPTPDAQRNWDNGYDLTDEEKTFVGLHIWVAIAALFVGSLFGPLQAFQYSGLDLYGLLDPIIKEVVLGHAEVRQTFKVPKIGMVAGCSCKAG